MEDMNLKKIKDDLFNIKPKLARNIHRIKLFYILCIVSILAVSLWQMFYGDLILVLILIFISVLLSVNYFFVIKTLKSILDSTQIDTSVYKEMSLPSKEDVVTETIHNTFQRLFFDAKTQHQSLSVILCDIDYLYDIKERYGKDVANMVIEEVQKEIENSIQNSEVVFSWTGEEFLILLPRTTYDNAYKFSLSLEKRIENLSVMYDSKPIRVSLTTGVTDIENSHSIYATIRNADSKMY